MYKISAKIMNLIKKTSKSKKHLKLNIGIMIGDNTVLKTYNENEEIEFEDNIYEIGSITKTFTATLFAKYVCENKIQLNDSIQKYIPELDPVKYYPNLKSLATHTSGYTEYQFSTWSSIQMLADTLLKRFKMLQENPLYMDYNKMIQDIKKNQMKDRAYKCAYSNFGISVLGYVLGVVSGLGYWDTMNDFIKNELKLSNTYLGTIAERNLNGFSPKNSNWGNWLWDKHNMIAPAGALSSTLKDLLSYAKMNMYEEKEYFALCHKKSTNWNIMCDMGLGWWLSKKDNNTVLHGGTTGCFDTFLGFNKEKKVAVAFLPNYRWGYTAQLNIGSMILEDVQKYV